MTIPFESIISRTSLQSVSLRVEMFNIHIHLMNIINCSDNHLTDCCYLLSFFTLYMHGLYFIVVLKCSTFMLSLCWFCTFQTYAWTGDLASEAVSVSACFVSKYVIMFDTGGMSYFISNM